MNKLIHRSNTLLGRLIISALVLIAVAVISVSNVTHADNGAKNQTGRLLTVHDRGNEKVILTLAATIGDALTEAGIAVDTNDAVEPALTEKLVASDYQVNIYRARPVIIIDGNSRTKVVTPYQTADQIVKSAGIKLYDEDITNLGRTDNIIADGAGLQLTITRATPFEFTLYGKTTTVRTQAKTILTMLTEKGIKLGADDRVSLDLNTVINEGIAVKIWREGKQTITVDEPINFEVEKIKDADREVGYVDVRTAGVEGSRSVSYEITIQDGIEVGRIEIASITTLQPIKQVQVVGAKGEYTTPTENEIITWDFLISSGFSKYQTAGIMGNLMQEHGFNTTDTSGGLGIAQWTDGDTPGAGRKSDLLARSNPYNIYTQLDFLMHELGTNRHSAFVEVKASTTIDQAVIEFQNKFEGCGLCRQDKRIQFAYDIYATFRDR